MKATELRSHIQQLLKDSGYYSGKIDGDFGPKTYAALRALDLAEETSIEPMPGVHKVKASSFADPADVAAFRRCKASGGSDQQCFKVGDNGVGLWGDNCTGDRPMCALPREDWMERWGSAAARGKEVVVTANGKTVVCELRDTMPRRANITNGCGIDLNPAAVAALGLRPPVLVTAQWQWAADV